MLFATYDIHIILARVTSGICTVIYFNRKEIKANDNKNSEVSLRGTFGGKE